MKGAATRDGSIADDIGEEGWSRRTLHI